MNYNVTCLLFLIQPKHIISYPFWKTKICSILTSNKKSSITKARRGRKCHTSFKWIWDSSESPSINDCQSLFIDSDDSRPYNHDFVGVTHPNQYSIPTKISKNHEKNFRIKRYFKIVGKGEETYDKLKHAILQWTPTISSSDQEGILMVGPLQNHVRKKRKYDLDAKDLFDVRTSATTGNENIYKIIQKNNYLVTFTRVLGSKHLWAINPCRIVYDVVDYETNENQVLTSTAYGTLKGHLLRGEERVTVGIKKKFNCNQNTNVVVPTSFFGGKEQEENQVFVEILSFSQASQGIIGKLAFHFCKNMQDRFFSQQMNTLEQMAK